MKRMLLLVLLAAACESTSGRQDHGGGDAGTGGGTDLGGTGGGGGGGGGGVGGGGGGGGQSDIGCTKMDLLFVVDDSNSMSEEQMNLGQNFPKFIDVLNSYKTGGGAPLDYRVAVTTTSLNDIPIIDNYDDGALRQKCVMTRRWIERADANVATTFSCVAAAGVNGNGHERPLAAAKRALTDKVTDGTNAGFLRTDALLAVVMLTDEDDQSPDATDAYIQAFDAIKGHHDRWAAAAVAGPTDCMSAFGSASEAVRLKDFIMKSGKQAVLASICDGDLSKSLDQALHTFSQACNSFPIP
jgi:hypothetical protein